MFARRFQRWVLLIGVNLALVGAALPGDLALTPAERTWLDEHPVVRLGPYANYPPLEYLDADGNYVGLSADYVKRLERILGIQFELVRTETWQALLDQTKAREIDVLALIANTSEREEYLAFCEPHLVLPVSLLTGRVHGELTMDRLGDLRVSVVKGYAVESWIRSNYPDQPLIPVPDTLSGLRMLGVSEIDVFVSDLAVAGYVVQQEGIPNIHVAGKIGF